MVFSLWAGLVPLITSPSSANTSAWKPHIHNQILQREPITHTSVNKWPTPERMTSPDSAIAPSLLSAYTTASFINTSSSSLQFGLQAPTAAQQQERNSLCTEFFFTTPKHWVWVICIGANLTRVLLIYVNVFILSSHLPRGLLVWPTDQTVPAQYIWLPSRWRPLPSPPPLLRHRASPDPGASPWTSQLSLWSGSTHEPGVKNQGE